MSDSPSALVTGSSRRLVRVARWTLIALSVFVMVISSLVAWNVHRSFPQTDGNLQLKGLSAPVEVKRDEWGVPQIYADKATDLFAAQGYVQAQDRFFEMDFRRHITAGRLSEMFGESQIETDASVRTMGWRRVAKQEWKSLDSASRDYFQAYADGVNSYLDDKSTTQVSLEYGVLGLTGLDYHIEKWSPVDSLAWLKAMAWDLRGNYSDELARATYSAGGLSDKQIADLYPPYPADKHKPIVTEGNTVDGKFDQDADGTAGDARVSHTTNDTSRLPALNRTKAATTAIDSVLGNSGANGIGSNSWVISGDLTTTGKPILANDPHLGPAMPSVWYQLGLHCNQVNSECPFNVTGFSFSGVPSVIIGHNSSASWGFTNLSPDVTDFYMERLHNNTYLKDDKWHKLKVRHETIKVADHKPVKIAVRSTDNGPLMSDQDSQLNQTINDPPVHDDQDSKRYGVSLRWTALKPSHSGEAIFDLAAMDDFDAFRDAAAKFEVPAQNLIYADTKGNIGYQMPGRIPLRTKGDGTMPAPGWDSDYDWNGYIDFDELPHVYNPDEGFLVTANNQAIGEQYPYHITSDWAYGYRSQRIRDMIEDSDSRVSVSDVKHMQMDSTNTGAPPVIDAISKLDNADSCRVCSVISQWDTQQSADSSGAAAFNAAWRHLLLDTFDELPDGAKPDGGERWAQVVAKLLDDPSNDWWDDKSTPDVETADDMLAQAVQQADEELSEAFGDDPADWRWGKMHTLTVRNQSLGTSGVGVIEAMFNAPTIETSGGGGLVNATAWDAGSGGYGVDAAPSMRMVVNMAELGSSQWINLTGNSGHAYHEHYLDQLPLWQEGKQLTMRWSRKQVTDTTVDTLTLRP